MRVRAFVHVNFSQTQGSSSTTVLDIMSVAEDKDLPASAANNPWGHWRASSTRVQNGTHCHRLRLALHSPVNAIAAEAAAAAPAYVVSLWSVEPRNPGALASVTGLKYQFLCRTECAKEGELNPKFQRCFWLDATLLEVIKELTKSIIEGEDCSNKLINP